MRKTKFERSHSSSKKGKSEISQKEEISRSPRNKSSLKYKEIKESIDNNSSIFGKAYTYNCEIVLPLIVEPNIYRMDKTQKLCKRFPFYCLTCYTHFFYDNKIAHENHSFVDLKKIEIKEDVIINSKKNIKRDANKLHAKKYESELINFISLVIKEYENEKSNLLKYYSYRTYKLFYKELKV